MKKIFALIVLVVFINKKSWSQNVSLGSWNITNITYRFNPKFSAFAEGQLRSLSFYDQFHYYEYKVGLHYKVQESFKISFAAGRYVTYKEGGDFVLPKNNDEIRLWPMATLTQKIGRFSVEQRYRMEMRFTSDGYRNRFRYRLGLAYPFALHKNAARNFKVVANNELFFTDREPYFERNRASINLQYEVSSSLSLQLGYLHQFDYKINDETGRDFLVLGLYYTIKGY